MPEEDPPTIEQLLTTEEELDPREAHLVYELRALIFRRGTLDPEELAEVSRLLAQWITVQNAITDGQDLPARPGVGDIGLFFPEQAEMGVGNLDREELRQVFRNLQSPEFVQGQTEEEAQLAQLLADPVMMVNGQYVHTATDVRLAGAGMDFVFTRTYKNQAYYRGPLGINWDHSHNLYLRVELGGRVLARSTGQLREDRYVLHEQGGYYLPPDGAHDVIVGRDEFARHAPLLASCADDLVAGHPYSYVLRAPGGQSILYAPLAGMDIHHAVKVRDRLGNFLLLDYDEEQRLRSVAVNHPERLVGFAYDQEGRIVEIRAWGVHYPWREDPYERPWRYHYDDLGDLVAVTSPPTGSYPTDGVPRVRGTPSGRTTCYEYSTADRVGELRHNLQLVVDATGQAYLENEYGEQQGLLSFNRVVSQRQGRGAYHFGYEDVLAEADWDHAPEEEPAHKTVLYERDGHPVEHYYNRTGQLIVKRETVRDGCGTRTLIWRFRYNPDAALVASLSPEGTVVQHYYGRDDFYDRGANPGDRSLAPSQDPALTPQERIRWGNLLATVRRGTRWTLRQLLARRPGSDGFDDVFPDRLRNRDPSDIIRKFTYATDYQQLLTESDPRFTTSADPHAHEPASHGAHLVRYAYDDPPARLLRRVRSPDTTFPEPLPDGTAGLQGLATEYLDYDARGRLLRRRDPAGYVTRWEYHGAAAGVREGYLRREIRHHSSLTLGQGSPELPDLVWTTGWTHHARHRLSDGELGRRSEIRFEGCGLTMHQDEDRASRHGQNSAVRLELLEPDGAVRPLPSWDQTQEAAYAIEGLHSGRYAVRLHDEDGAPVSLGRADVFVQLEYETNEAGVVTAITNPRGLRSEVVVNEADQVIATIGPPPWSYPTYTSYDANGRIERTWQRLDPPVDGEEFLVSSRRYDEQDNLVEEIAGVGRPDALVTRHVYDGSDRRIRTIRPRGNDVRYRHDERGLVVAVASAACTPEASIVRTAFDGDGRKVAITSPVGQTTRTSYDALGRVVAIEDPLGNVRRICYDKRDNPVAEHFFEKRDGRFFLLTHIAFEYDELGRKRRMIQYVFDEPIDARDFDASRGDLDPLNPAVFSAFFEAVDAGLISELHTESYLDAGGRIFRSRRYGLLAPAAGGNQPVRTRQEWGEQDHDAAGRVLWSRDGLGHTTVTTYDPNGNPLRRDVHEPVVDPTSGALLHVERRSRLYAYDALNRQTAAVDPLGNRTRTWYDSRDNPVRTEDALGRVTRRDYDAYGRLTRVVHELTATGLGGTPVAEEVVTRFEHDANGNVTAVVDPRGVVTHYTYDALDRRVRIDYDHPHGGSHQEWRYDAAGRLLMYRDANGLALLRRYDALDHVVATTLDASGVARADELADDVDDAESFAYDALGRVLLQGNKESEIETAYDSMGRPLRERLWWRTVPPGLAQPLVLARDFDIFGNLRQLTYPDGRQIRYEHDEIHRVTAVVNQAKGDRYPGHPATPDVAEIARHHYAGLRLLATRYANGAGTRFTYDAGGRTIEIAHHGPGETPRLHIQQLHDATANKRLETDVRPDPANPAATVASSEDYVYDSLSRLTHYEASHREPFDPTLFQAPRALPAEDELDGQAAIDQVLGDIAQGAAHTYRYDTADNRLDSGESGGPQLLYAPNRLNQYEHVADAGGGVLPLAYDSCGSLTLAGPRRYRYNARRQVTRVEDGGQLIARFRYDVQGRLLATAYPLASEEVYLLHDGPEVIAEYEPTPAGWRCRTQYVNGRGLDGRYQLATGGREYYYHRNAVRSTRALSDRDGTYVEYEYEPFGSLRWSSPGAAQVANPYLFSGRRYDPHLAAYDFRTRLYAPEWGRFLQRDPKGETNGANLYVALANNPGLYVDPMGTEKIVSFVEEPDPVLVLSTSDERYRTQEEAELQEWWGRYREAGSEQERASLRRELRNQGAKEWAQFALVWYSISTAGALAAGAPLFLAARFGLQLAPLPAAVISGASGALGEEAASAGFGKQVSVQSFLEAGFLGALAGGTVAYLGGRLSRLQPQVPIDTVKIVPRTKWYWDRSNRANPGKVMADYYKALHGEAYTGGSKLRAQQVMAEVVGGQPDADWSHLWMRAGGGPDRPWNFVSASRGSNYVQRVYEMTLLDTVKAGRIVEAEKVATIFPGTDVGKRLRYRAWIDGEEVLDGVLDLVRTQCPTSPEVNWWFGQGEYNPARRTSFLYEP